MLSTINPYYIYFHFSQNFSLETLVLKIASVLQLYYKRSTYHYALIRIIKSFQQLYTCTFSATALSHQCQGLPTSNADIETLKDCDVLPRRVGKTAVFKLNISPEVILKFLT